MQVDIPDDFPFNPPKFYFLTPQGVYQTNTNICISIGHYHSQSYRPTLGIAGFCTQIVSGLIGWETLGSGIGIIKTDLETKRRMAQASADYNARTHGRIIEAIEDSYQQYSATWKKADEISPNP